MRVFNRLNLKSVYYYTVRHYIRKMPKTFSLVDNLMYGKTETSNTRYGSLITNLLIMRQNCSYEPAKNLRQIKFLKTKIIVQDWLLILGKF